MVLVVKKGSKMSEESKKKISDRMKEVRKEIPNPMSGRTGELHHNFGKHWDEETRKKMSDAKKGKPSTFKGKRHTEEAKQKNSDAHKGKIAWNKGLKTGPHTKEHNQHIADGVLKYPKGKGQWYTKLDGNDVWMRSSFEIRVATALDNLNISWEYEPACFSLENRNYHPDFLIDGKIWWEVKGWIDDISASKLMKFSEIYPDENIKIIFNESIEELEDISNGTSFKDISELGITFKQYFDQQNE